MSERSERWAGVLRQHCLVGSSMWDCSCKCGAWVTGDHTDHLAAVLDALGDDPAQATVERVTDDEATKIDHAMAEHMYGHQISNAPHYFACDSACRTRALQRAAQQMLDDRAALDPETGP